MNLSFRRVRSPRGPLKKGVLEKKRGYEISFSDFKTVVDRLKKSKGLKCHKDDVPKGSAVAVGSYSQEGGEC